jgi:hypothetical protein
LINKPVKVKSTSMFGKQLLAVIAITIGLGSVSFINRRPAEKMSLCKSINHVAKAMENGKVSSLLGEKSGDRDGISIYDATVDVEGLEDEFIADSETETVFFATYIEKSTAKLRARYDELKSQVSKCLDKTAETDKFENIETSVFKFSEKVTVELTLYHDDFEIDLNIDFSKE